MEWILFPIALGAFVAFWAGIVFLTSVISGWRELAKQFRAEQPFTGQRWKWQGGKLQWIWMRNCLTIGADGRGLSMGISSIFRFGYPELFVPWSAIVVTPQGDCVAFQMAGVSLCLEAALAEKLRLASLG